MHSRLYCQLLNLIFHLQDRTWSSPLTVVTKYLLPFTPCQHPPHSYLSLSEQFWFNAAVIRKYRWSFGTVIAVTNFHWIVIHHWSDSCWSRSVVHSHSSSTSYQPDYKSTDIFITLGNDRTVILLAATASFEFPYLFKSIVIIVSSHSNRDFCVMLRFLTHSYHIFSFYTMRVLSVYTY